MDDRLGVEALLAPLDGGVGHDVRSGAQPGLYLAIKDARSEARVAERDALTSGDPDAAPLLAGLRSWQTVVDGGRRLLSEEAKDLQVAAWLTEAWLRTDGFPGLAAGFALLAGLVERYWDQGLYPQEDEEGVETRVQPLFGLFGSGDTGMLLQPIKLLPLSDGGDTAVALWTIEAIRAQSTRHDDPDVAEQLAERRRTRMAAMEDAIARASDTFAEETAQAIADALAALDRLMTAIDARAPFGRFGTQVARPLEDAAALLRAHRHEPAAEETPAEMPVAPEAADPADSEPEPLVPAQPIVAAPPPAEAPMTREKALATLLEVAAFFDRNEPQSLVGHSLRDVVRRANLTMDALLAELLPDGEQRALFLLRAGISGAAGEGNDF
ncbi:type VI secretion system protein TssA [Sphingomonas jatrophae]|uniref:Type VI secretion system protein ImpA n=1 Tax=Sphingomonas jatrophae TaxID=1166337 RepID=A0A1I6M2K5_9SPHN|nr:type VI secretion system protein TssA [Sphingomonas jatrophae]SFS09742.1 type VI secretion system protein ImpA [Sphingomonas jatrophae]